MLTFQEIFLKLPFAEEQPRIKSRYMFLFIFGCLAVCGCLLFAGYHWNNKNLIYAILVPIGLMFMAVLAYAIVEGREIVKAWGKPENALLVSLDQFFADEKIVAAELAKGMPLYTSLT